MYGVPRTKYAAGTGTGTGFGLRLPLQPQGGGFEFREKRNGDRPADRIHFRNCPSRRVRRIDHEGEGLHVGALEQQARQAQAGLLGFLEKGVDLKQINIGIAAYGRPVDGGQFWANWRDVPHEDYWNSLQYNVDCDGQLEDFAFCAPALAGDKTAYALLSGAGGVMVFRLACDKTPDHPDSVAAGIANALNRYVE